ncbi:hypothetical protein [Acetivibrio ethanolgignens]|uniref:Uncharacterized protein n=1 Tax=Acetivibrio ethanolgignens TaxID=290052 RepID=A0A0V8QFZ4_9FIRM|nr:hypothetical protein [Acetivibrio ethanolgignens]KSV59509.1 hypothetical protein ASU35_08340 [Acetivibrio ethanolgignens]
MGLFDAMRELIDEIKEIKEDVEIFGPDYARELYTTRPSIKITNPNASLVEKAMDSVLDHVEEKMYDARDKVVNNAIDLYDIYRGTSEDEWAAMLRLASTFAGIAINFTPLRVVNWNIVKIVAQSALDYEKNGGELSEDILSVDWKAMGAALVDERDNLLNNVSGIDGETLNKIISVTSLLEKNIRNIK